MVLQRSIIPAEHQHVGQTKSDGTRMRALKDSTLVAGAAMLVLVGSGCAAPVRSTTVSSMASSGANHRNVGDWDEFWRAHSVSPPPPKTFLDYDAEPSDILNLTHGLLGDDVVRRWILADVRRGKGDAWAANHLRIDIVGAGVLGPAGLNGTDHSISKERAKGTVEIVCKSGMTVAAGVIAVQKETQRRIPWAELTDFVIVQVFQATGEPCIRRLSDGTTETIPIRRQRGELSWQLDTGEFRDDPVVGPLWYQARGWSCKMDGTGDLDEICGLVQPRGRTAAMAAQHAVAADGPAPRR